MPCPFGYTADDIEDEEEEEEEQEYDGAGSQGGELQAAGTEGKPGKSKDKEKGEQGASGDPTRGKKLKNKGPAIPLDMEGDPLSWFYSNQIKCEEDFQAKKDELRNMARQRLDQIMDKKNQRMLWPSDSEFDNMSLSSGELSELDSDVHSLASVRSCAYSWVASANYSAPAELAVKIAGVVGLVTAIITMYIGYLGMTTVKPVMGVLRHSEWATYDFLAALALSGSAATAIMAANWRSKRMLLMSQVLLIITLVAAVCLSTLTWAKPPKMDHRMQQALCGKSIEKLNKGQPNPMCDQLPMMKALVERSASSLQWSATGMAAVSAIMACLGMWYTLELCFIEKKGVKHMRRHRRRRFTIPWEKIQIVGKPLPCGQGGMAAHAASGAKGGAKCPFTRAPAPKDKTV